MATIICLFRNSSYFSIEHLFDVLHQYLSQSCKFVKVPKSGAKFQSLIQNLLWGIKLRKEDVIHITGDINYMALITVKSRTILTIHDLGHLKCEKYFFKKLLLKILWYSIPLRKTKYITCISNATRIDLINEFPWISKDKIYIIPDPIDSRYQYNSYIFNYSCPNILFIGAKPNKNLPRVIEALKDIPCKLRIIAHLSDEYRKLLDISDVSWSNAENLCDEEMIDEYRKCDMLCFPSLSEGFGLPILEAQATGRPVITSNCSSMPEVAGSKGALFVNPESIESIHKGIKRLINDDFFRNQLIINGQENVKNFLPRNIANQYNTLYQKIIDENR